MRPTWKSLAGFAGLCLSAVATVATAADIFPYEVQQKTLDNGLQLVVIPYDSPGTVSYYTVVRTGSRDEVEKGHSGFAHFFEHMMFQGTDRFSEADYNAALKRMGADSNAFTTDDFTAYYMTGPAAELEVMVDLESDRFKNLNYSEDSFRREALAILGEYNKNASNPFLPMYERMRELAFREHTYGHTTMGYLEDIEAMPGYYDYSLGFFDRYYRPENVAVLVVGDVDPEAFFEMAHKYYGDWEAGYQAPRIEPEPEQKAALSGHIDWPAPIRPYLMAGYRVPAFSSDTVDSATLDVISQLLFSESAPLYQKLVVEEQWVDFVSGSYSNHRDPYLFTIYARIKSEDLVDKVREAIDSHIAELQAGPVSEARLERTKSYLRYSFSAELDTPDSVAGTIAHYIELTGDPLTVNRLYEQYQKVSAEDVVRLAKQVFKPSRQTVVTLSHPASGKEGA